MKSSERKREHANFAKVRALYSEGENKYRKRNGKIGNKEREKDVNETRIRIISIPFRFVLIRFFAFFRVVFVNGINRKFIVAEFYCKWTQS